MPELCLEKDPKSGEFSDFCWLVHSPLSLPRTPTTMRPEPSSAAAGCSFITPPMEDALV